MDRSLSNRRTGGPSLGAIVLGLGLIVIGVLWLLDAFEVLAFPWFALLPALLIVVGVALIAGAPSGTHGGLIGLGIVLTLLVSVVSLVDVPLTGSVGEPVVQPASAAELQDGYSLAAGTLTLDLRQLQLPAGDTAVDAEVGAGELTVLVPSEIPVVVDWQVGVGEASVLGQERDGLGLEGRVTSPQDGASERRLLLDLSVGVGTVEVRR